MNEPLGYSRDGDTVTLRMSRDDYEAVVVGLGCAAGAAPPDLLWRWLSVANRVNEGNPQWTPYAIPEGAARYDAEPSENPAEDR